MPQLMNNYSDQPLARKCRPFPLGKGQALGVKTYVGDAAPDALYDGGPVAGIAGDGNRPRANAGAHRQAALVALPHDLKRQPRRHRHMAADTRRLLTLRHAPASEEPISSTSRSPPPKLLF